MAEALIGAAAEKLIGVAAELILKQLFSGIRENISLISEFKSELDRLEKEVEMVQAMLRDAKRRTAMDTNGVEAVKLWMKDLEDFAYKAADVLDELAYEALRRKVKIVSTSLPSSSSQPSLLSKTKEKAKKIFKSSEEPSIFSKRKMGEKIKEIFTSLETINKQAAAYGLQMGTYTAPPPPLPHVRPDRETDSFVNFSKVVGRVDDASKIVGILTCQSNVQTLSVLPIVGMGGVGKTTLAKLVYNNEEIKGHFKKMIWLCVSDDFTVKRLFKEMLESLAKNKCEVDTMDAILGDLSKELDEEKYLLVLDDVWNDDPAKWTDFVDCLTNINTSSGSKILITTRSTEVASVGGTCDPYFLNTLSNDQCWSIFKALAFENGVPSDEEFESIGREIVNKCGGLPLAAKLAGSMMRSKKEKHEWWLIVNSGVWNSPDDKSGVLPILKLSYDNLPLPSVKHCFAYCALFKKDDIMVKENLIQLWMASGYLQPSGDNLEMEDIGDKYFNILVRSSMFQDIETNCYGNIKSFKMHDLVYDLAQHISKPQVFNAEANTNLGGQAIRHIRHLALDYHGDEETLATIRQGGADKLRTIFNSHIEICNGLVEFKCLRVLELKSSSYMRMDKNFPISISEFKHLKYLDLSMFSIEDWPDITKLYHLQTLRLGRDTYLPKDLRKLMSLRHLYFQFSSWKSPYSPFQMPLGIGVLTCLQTLPLFVVGKEKGRQIEELGSLKLGGELHIGRLEEVKSKEEAESANLQRKGKIHKLKLSWSWFRQSDRDCKNDHDVLEGLQPHPNLKVLEVKHFEGDKFPVWMMNMVVSVNNRELLLANLVEIKLRLCIMIEEIPTLGQLPRLQFLNLSCSSGVKRIGESFYGVVSSKALFPSLKELVLEHLGGLEEWVEAKTKTTTVAEEEGMPELVVFPCLEKLTIISCPRLKTAPSHFPSLKELKIKSVDSGSPVVSICSKVTTLTHLNLTHVSNLISLPDGLFQNNKCLRKLEFCECHHQKSIPSLEGLKFLSSLLVHSCGMLESLPQGLQSCTSLNNLAVCLCKNVVVSTIEDIQQLPTSLSSLSLIECPKLTSFPWDPCSLTHLEKLQIGNVQSFHDRTNPLAMDIFEGIQHIQVPIHNLTLVGLCEWDTLPQQLQYLTYITSLTLVDFGVEALPDWFGNLESLEVLNIIELEALKYLPSSEAISRLTKLRLLKVFNCPLLEERCKEGNRPEWSKIPTTCQVVFSTDRYSDSD